MERIICFSIYDLEIENKQSADIFKFLLYLKYQWCNIIIKSYLGFKVKWYFSLFPARPNLDGVWSTAQPLALSSSPWTFTATRLHSSYIRDWISSTSLILLPMTSHNRVSSFYSSSSDSNNGRDRIWSPDPLSQPTSDCQPVVLSSEQRQYPLFDNKNIRGILYDSSQTSLIDNGMTTSSFFDNKLKSSSMSSYAPRLSNFRLSKDEEAPMILFDQNGNMYTNYFPPFHRRAPQQ